ncbi:MAG: hypothetical protein AAF216_12405 [Pseudomonadota bacterium]
MPRAREKGPWFWRGLIAIMVTGVFGLFAAAALSSPPATIGDTACRLDRKDPAHTVVLIDQSDPFSENDMAWVASLIEGEARTLPRNGRLTVITPNSSDAHAPRIVHSACSTGSPDRANPILSNPRMVADTWRVNFIEPAMSDVDQALSNTQAPSSPLFESLYAIADRPDFQSGTKDRRLVIVSDLMQHSDDFSFYRTGADFGAFTDASLNKQVPNFAGAEVVARIVPRPIYDLPMADVRAFWRAWFDEANAEFGVVSGVG